MARPKKSEPLKTRIDIRVEPELLAEVDAQAEAEGVTRTAIFEEGAALRVKAGKRKLRAVRKE